MTEAVQLELIRTIPQIMSAVGIMFGAWLAFSIKRISVRTLEQAQETHLQINSRMDELLAITKTSAQAQGNLEGRAAERADRGIK